MAAKIQLGDRVALTANAVKFTQLPKHQHSAAKLRGEVIAILGSGFLAVVQWDGVADEDANHTYGVAGLCKPRSVAFSEVRGGNPDLPKGL